LRPSFFALIDSLGESQDIRGSFLAEVALRRGYADADRHSADFLLRPTMKRCSAIDARIFSAATSRPSESVLVKDDGEFLAAVAADDVAPNTFRLTISTTAFKNVVAGDMTPDIVDALEMIDVEQGEAEPLSAREPGRWRAMLDRRLVSKRKYSSKKRRL
jgi:hypothetical protein